MLARYWPGEGARHDAALTLGGFLARCSLKPPEIKCLVEAIAKAAGDNEWRDRIRAADVVIHLTRRRADTDVSFKLEFRKARERRPDNREDFQPVNIFWVDDSWHSAGCRV